MLKYGEMLENHCKELNDLLRDTLEKNKEIIIEISGKIINSFRNGGKVIIFGNGGSAAEAQHFAAELVCQFEKKRQAIPAIALTTDSSILTAQSNDYSFNSVF